MININKNLNNCVFSGIADVIKKANELNEDVIRLEVGDVDLETSELVIEGLKKGIEHKNFHYPPLKGDSELIELIVNDLKKENIYVSKEQIIITCGGSMGMFLALNSTINTDDEIIIFEPIWPHLVEMIKIVGGKPILVPLDRNLNFHINIQELKKYITVKTKAIVINTPNNPTGVVYSKKELEELCLFAKDNNILIISDEEYCNYVYDNNKFISPLFFNDETIVSRSFSKTLSVSGLRLGYLVVPLYLINDITKMSLFTSMYPSSISQCAVIHSMKNNDNFSSIARKIFEERMNFVVNEFNKIKGVTCERSEGSVYVWVKFENCNDDIKLCDEILNKCHVSLVPGSVFGKSGHGFARVSLGQDINQLTAAINRIKKYMEK